MNLAAVVCASVVVGQVVNPRITTDSTVDSYSAEEVVRQIIKPGMTDEEKVRACWRFMLDHFYHWYPPREPDTQRDVRDFAKMINSYGFGPCFVAAPVQTALWEAAGFRTRSWTITGHAIPEVYYDGAWRMLDPDARAWHRTADGAIAGVEDLSKDPTLFTNPKEKSNPYYPFGAPDAVVKPLDPWGPPSKMMDLYLSRRDNYRYNKRAVMGHPMYLTLRPGESITLCDTNDGKFFDAGYPKDKLDTGPVDVTGRHTYGTGDILWNPDFAETPPEDLLWLGSKDFKVGTGGLIPAKAGQPAVAVFRVWCPYVIVGVNFTIDFTGDMRNVDAEVSVDNGRVWSKPELVNLDSSGDTEDAAARNWSLGYFDRPGFNRQAQSIIPGRYGYLVRVTFSDGLLQRAFFNTTFQLAPLSLPRLKPGKNRVTAFRGPDEGVVALTLAKGKPAKERYLVGSKNISINKAVQPVTYQEPAHAVYRLTAPAALTALSIGGNLTMDRGKGQHIAASYSLDAGKTWTEVWRVADNDNPQNSQFEEDRRVPLKNPAGAKEALIRFAMLRNSKYFGVNSIRLYAFYRQPQPKDAHLNVRLEWQERMGETWVAKSHDREVRSFPQTFDLTCGGEAVRLRSIRMTVPR